MRTLALLCCCVIGCADEPGQDAVMPEGTYQAEIGVSQDTCIVPSLPSGLVAWSYSTADGVMTIEVLGDPSVTYDAIFGLHAFTGYMVPEPDQGLALEGQLLIDRGGGCIGTYDAYLYTTPVRDRSGVWLVGRIDYVMKPAPPNTCMETWSPCTAQQTFEAMYQP